MSIYLSQTGSGRRRSASLGACLLSVGAGILLALSLGAIHATEAGARIPSGREISDAVMEEIMEDPGVRGYDLDVRTLDGISEPELGVS